MYSKPFKTYEEQLLLLKNRGLIINDEPKALALLREENYYRLSGYTLTLRNAADIYYPGVSIDDALQIYNFDKELRLLLLKHLESIEIALRTHVAYELGKIDFRSPQGSSISYLSPANYVSEEHFIQFCSNLAEAHKNNNNEAFIKHHDAKYNGVLPPWVMTETLSFGMLSRMFESLNIDIKKTIAREYYGSMKCNVLDNWFEGLVVLRNMCAHHVRLVNRGLPNSPMFSKEDQKYLYAKGYDGNSIGKRVFFRLIIIARVSPNPKQTCKELQAEIDNLCKKYPFVDLKHYGFKHDWQEMMDYLIS